MKTVECMELFPDSIRAVAYISDNSGPVLVNVFYRDKMESFDMNVDKISNFLDQCRRAQNELVNNS